MDHIPIHRLTWAAAIAAAVFFAPATGALGKERGGGGGGSRGGAAQAGRVEPAPSFSRSSSPAELRSSRWSHGPISDPRVLAPPSAAPRTLAPMAESVRPAQSRPERNVQPQQGSGGRGGGRTPRAEPVMIDRPAASPAPAPSQRQPQPSTIAPVEPRPAPAHSHRGEPGASTSSHRSSHDHQHHKHKHHHHHHDHGHHRHRDSGTRVSVSIGVVWSTCGSCGLRYHGYHSCAPAVAVIYTTCGSCGIRYIHGHHHSCGVRYVSCGGCGVRYVFGASHVCGARYISCHVCFGSYLYGSVHVCRAPRVVYISCGSCGIRYVSGSFHSCGPSLTIAYTRCGSCGISYRSGWAHTCASVAPLYASCGHCGVRYLSTSVHTCAGRSLTVAVGVGTHSCSSCGVVYAIGSFHACNRPAVYFRCGLCGVSYRSTHRHVCASRSLGVAVVSETGVAAEVPARAAPLGGWAKLSDDKFDEALADFDSDIAANPNAAEAHAGRAVVLGMTGRDADAIAAMRRAVEIDPESLRSLPADGNIAGMVRHLLSTYRNQAQAAQRPVDLWFIIAALSVASGDDAGAWSALEESAKIGDAEPSTAELRKSVAARLGRAAG